MADGIVSGLIEDRIPPLVHYFSDQWIEGSAMSLITAQSGISDVISSGAGELLGLAELADEAIAGVTGAVEQLIDLGENVISILTSGDAFSIVGWATAAIKLFYGRIVASLQKSFADSQTNALRYQWLIANELVLARTRKAKDLPGQWGGGNFTMVQPGVKKDWPKYCFPPVPPRSACAYDKEGKPIGCTWSEPVLFSTRSPNDTQFKVDCFFLGDQGCPAPPDSVIGVSFLTWPYLVERYGVPWGGGHLVPFFSMLTSPTVIHVQVRQAEVDALRQRMRRAMRLMWRIRNGPPISETDVTVWPDGSYVAPGRPDALINANIGLKRFGESPAQSYLDPELYDLDLVSQAFRSLERWAECRAACLRHFDILPADVRKIARERNATDFSDENIARWGGRPRP